MLCVALVVSLSFSTAGCAGASGARRMAMLQDYTLNHDTPTDPELQRALERIDSDVRIRHGLHTDEVAVGLLDLRAGRLAMIHPDRIEYAASVPKVGILLAWFALNPAVATNLDAGTRHELGLMVKVSSNEMAAKYSRQLGLKRIQEVLDGMGFYNESRGGGIWVGKHYGQGGERVPDPVGGHSHAATVRQLLRFYLLLEQGRLVSPEASERMREIFASPEIAHDQMKFVQGLAGRDVDVLRKSGSWEQWLHDTALVSGPGRRYVLVALTHHPRGDEYLAVLAAAVDDLMSSRPSVHPVSSGR